MSIEKSIRRISHQFFNELLRILVESADITKLNDFLGDYS